MLIQHDKIRAVCRALIAATGSIGDEPDIVADHLVEANLKGHDSHGIGMIPRYIGLYNRGLLQPNQSIRVMTDAAPFLVVHGNAGYGQSVARQAIDLAIGRAKAAGACLLSLRNANHIGRVGTYGERAVAAGLASIHFVNANGHVPRVAPFGGSESRLATNPMTVALPTGLEGRPMILDFATSSVAMGKVRVAKNKGERMDGDVLLDSTGRPTDDPNVMFQRPIGAIRAFGLHKGYGLGLACELLAGGMTGGGTNLPRTQEEDTIVNNMFAIVFDPARLSGSGAAEALGLGEIAEMIDYVASSPPADPAKPVLIPGDPERARMEERMRDGIPLDPATWEELLSSGETLGLSRSETKKLAA